MRFLHLALPFISLVRWSSALPVDASSKALATRESSDVELYDDLEKRRGIDVYFLAYTHSLVSYQMSISDIAEHLAGAIKDLSDRNTCQHIVTHVANLAVSYYATTTGSNCDTTAQKKTIRNALTKALYFALNTGTSAAIFEFDHGGTWNGHLQVIADANAATSVVDASNTLAKMEKAGRDSAMQLI